MFQLYQDVTSIDEVAEIRTFVVHFWQCVIVIFCTNLWVPLFIKIFFVDFLVFLLLYLFFLFFLSLIFLETELGKHNLLDSTGLLRKHRLFRSNENLAYPQGEGGGIEDDHIPFLRKGKNFIIPPA